MTKTKSYFIHLLILLSAVFTQNAFAISIDIVPNIQTVQSGDTVSADIVISGLTSANEIVSAYDLNIGYDASILDATSVTFGSYLDDLFFPGFSLQSYDLSVNGIVNFAELSLLSNADLALQQPDSFVLATLNFAAIGVGDSPLSFIPSASYGIDVKGTNPTIPLSLTAGNGFVTVKSPIGVPEPNTVLLLIVGLLGLSLRSKRSLM